jgi:hypothetical protein
VVDIEISDYIKGWEFLDQLSDYELLKEYAPRNSLPYALFVK